MCSYSLVPRLTDFFRLRGEKANPFLPAVGKIGKVGKPGNEASVPIYLALLGAHSTVQFFLWIIRWTR